MEELIAKRYVNALLSISSADERALYVELLNCIADTYSNSEVTTMIDAPIISSKAKAETIISALGKDVDEKFTNFIKLLAEHKRLGLIPNIAQVINAQLQKESNEYEGVVRSKKKLDAGSVAKLEETLKRYTGSSIKLSLEKSDLDGLRVDVDDLGIEVNFSKERVKEQLIDFIMKSQ